MGNLRSKAVAALLVWIFSILLNREPAGLDQASGKVYSVLPEREKDGKRETLVSSVRRLPLPERDIGARDPKNSEWKESYYLHSSGGTIRLQNGDWSQSLVRQRYHIAYRRLVSIEMLRTELVHGVADSGETKGGVRKAAA